jgi:hypothetical protein
VTKDEVVNVARQRPATTPRNHTRPLKDSDGMVHIQVEIACQSPYLLFPHGFRQAQYAHRGLVPGKQECLRGPPEHLAERDRRHHSSGGFAVVALARACARARPVAGPFRRSFR